jgi:RNA polymerase sigma-70 factor (ECF subfamily)
MALDNASSSSESTRPSLLVRVRDPNDRAAWQEFDAIYRAILMRYARGRGLSPEAAEEVAQECLVRLSQRLPEFEYSPIRGRFRGFLKTMVVRLVIDSLRRRHPHLSDDQLLGAADTGESPEQVYERLEQGALARHCLEQIRHELRGERTYEVFCRRVLDGWPVEKICKEYGMTREQVDGIKFRVSRKIQQRLTAEFGEAGD